MFMRRNNKFYQFGGELEDDINNERDPMRKIIMAYTHLNVGDNTPQRRQFLISTINDNINSAYLHYMESKREYLASHTDTESIVSAVIDMIVSYKLLKEFSRGNLINQYESLLVEQANIYVSRLGFKRSNFEDVLTLYKYAFKDSITGLIEIFERKSIEFTEHIITHCRIDDFNNINTYITRVSTILPLSSGYPLRKRILDMMFKRVGKMLCTVYANRPVDLYNILVVQNDYDHIYDECPERESATQYITDKMTRKINENIEANKDKVALLFMFANEHVRKLSNSFPNISSIRTRINAMLSDLCYKNVESINDFVRFREYLLSQESDYTDVLNRTYEKLVMAYIYREDVGARAFSFLVAISSFAPNEELDNLYKYIVDTLINRIINADGFLRSEKSFNDLQTTVNSNQALRRLANLVPNAHDRMNEKIKSIYLEPDAIEKLIENVNELKAKHILFRIGHEPFYEKLIALAQISVDYKEIRTVIDIIKDRYALDSPVIVDLLLHLYDKTKDIRTGDARMTLYNLRMHTTDNRLKFRIDSVLNIDITQEINTLDDLNMYRSLMLAYNDRLIPRINERYLNLDISKMKTIHDVDVYIKYITNNMLPGISRTDKLTDLTRRRNEIFYELPVILTLQEGVHPSERIEPLIHIETVVLCEPYNHEGINVNSINQNRVEIPLYNPTFTGTDIKVNDQRNWKDIVLEYKHKLEYTERLRTDISTMLNVLMIPINSATRYEVERYLTERETTYVPSEGIINFVNLMLDAARANLRTNNGKMLMKLHNVKSVLVVGDIHGDIASLFIILRTYIMILRQHPKTCIVFLGDYVDRAFGSLDVIYILALLKKRYPNRFFIGRGNHETFHLGYDKSIADTTVQRGLLHRFNESLNDTYLGLLAYSVFMCSLHIMMVSNKLFCVHGNVVRTNNSYTGRLIRYDDPNFVMEEADLTFTTSMHDEFGQCFLWADYFIDNGGRGTNCNTIIPAEMDKFILENGLRIFVKAHDHRGANTILHDRSKDLYITISSLGITAKYCKDKIIYGEDSPDKFKPIETIPNNDGLEEATILLINTETQEQEVIKLKENISDPEVIHDLYNDIRGYYKTYFGSEDIKYITNQRPDTPPISKASMKTAHIDNYEDEIIVENPECYTINDLCKILDALETQ